MLDEIYIQFALSFTHTERMGMEGSGERDREREGGRKQ